MMSNEELEYIEEMTNSLIVGLFQDQHNAYHLIRETLKQIYIKGRGE